MSNTSKEPSKLAADEAGGDNIEGQNPTRGAKRNRSKQAKRTRSTEGVCADLRAEDMPPALLIDRLLTTAGRAWLVAVGRLLHLEDECADTLPECLIDFGPARSVDQVQRMDPAYLLAHARVLGATIIACRSAYGRLPETAHAARVLRSVVSVAQVSAPSYRYQRHLELLGLHWVEQCLSALEVAASDWPDKALALAHIPEDGALPTWGQQVMTLAERHAVDVVAQTLPANAPEPMPLVAQALTSWEWRGTEVLELLEEDAKLPEDHEVAARTAFQILWRIGQAAQVVARLRAHGGTP